MFVYLLKRLLLAGFTMFAILLVSYLLLRLAPGDPTKTGILGQDAGGSLTADRPQLGVNDALRKKLNLDRPIYEGFFIWLGDALKGDFGTSATVEPGRPVTTVIMSRLPITLRLNLLAILLTYLLAVPTGILAAGKPNSLFDRTTTVTMFMLYSLPVIWVGLVLQSTLAAGGLFPVFPVKGMPPEWIPGIGWFRTLLNSAMYYVLPVTCLTYAGFAGIARYTRGSMIEELRSDYIRTACAKGVSESGILFHHAFRNSVITLITLLSGLLPGLVAGSIIVEQIFGIPGMGSLSITSLLSRDYPLQMAIFAFAGMLTLAGILCSDLLYMLADPRISLLKKR